MDSPPPTHEVYIASHNSNRGLLKKIAAQPGVIMNSKHGSHIILREIDYVWYTYVFLATIRYTFGLI